ncbi:MAG: DUF3169 family protein [Roseburia sp.]|nr:DUF3169 family protein [Roseburia sp.]
MRNEGLDDIRAEDRRKKKLFLVILAVSAFVGGAVGFTFTMLEGFFCFAGFGEAAAGVVAESSWYLNVIVTLIAMAAYFPLYRSSRRLYERWDGEDEAVINRIESRLGLALSIASVQQVLTVIITLICAQAHIKTLEEGMLWKKEIWFFAGWIGALVFSMTAQRRAVNLEKEINPEKRGSVYDMRFKKKWFESCDEAEKLIIYRASYNAHQAVTIACMVLSVFCLLGTILWGSGIFPVCIIGIIWLTDTLTYCISSYRLSATKQIR